MHVIDEDIVDIVLEHRRFVDGLEVSGRVSKCTNGAAGFVWAITNREESARKDIQQTRFAASTISQQDQLALDNLVSATERHRGRW